MRQQTLADNGFERFRKRTRRETFLLEMDQIIPWRDLCKVIKPFYPKRNGAGRPPVGLERMLFFNNNSFGINKPIFPLFVCWLDTQFDAMIQKLFFRFTFDIMGTQNRVYFLVRSGPSLFVES